MRATPAVWETVEFLIDSGAIYSIVPRPILLRLGISPLAEQTFRLATGQSIRRQTGAALFKYQDRIGPALVIFGEDDDATLLGAHTLEALGYALDPVRRELTPLPMILALLSVTHPLLAGGSTRPRPFPTVNDANPWYIQTDATTECLDYGCESG